MSYNQIINIIIFNRNAILRATIISTIAIFLILLFIYPVTYKATVTVLPPENEPKMGSLSSLLGAQDFSGLLTGGLSNANSQLFMEILKSRSAALYVVRKNNLKKFYNEENEIIAADELSKKLNLELTKEGIIKINVDVSTTILPSVFDNPAIVKNLAAELSNSYVEALDSINREKLSSKAKRAREYIEDELTKTKVSLDSSETALMNFQKKNKAIALPEQVNAAIEAAAKLKTEIVQTEIELGLTEPNLREDNKTLVALKNKLSELKQQYNKMEMGNQDYLVAFKEVPELGRELATLVRDVKIQNEVYMLLQQQYYKEKIQENRDLPTVEVLDEAIPPLKASSPRTIFSSILGGIFVFLLMSAIFIYSEKRTIEIKKVKEPNNV